MEQPGGKQDDSPFDRLEVHLLPTLRPLLRRPCVHRRGHPYLWAWLRENYSPRLFGSTHIVHPTPQRMRMYVASIVAVARSDVCPHVGDFGTPIRMIAQVLGHFARRRQDPVDQPPELRPQCHVNSTMPCPGLADIRSYDAFGILFSPRTDLPLEFRIERARNGHFQIPEIDVGREIHFPLKRGRTHTGTLWCGVVHLVPLHSGCNRREEALLIAAVCSDPLAGRRRLAEQSVKPWQHKMWCIPCIDSEYVARMEDVLDLFGKIPDPRRPVVCSDETPVQLIDETRIPWPAQPGKPARIDHEYRRHGTANLLVFLNAHQPWRHVNVTERKTPHDFVRCMHELVEVHYRDAVTVRGWCSTISRRTTPRHSTRSSRRG